jgi:hypothetical protein
VAAVNTGELLGRLQRHYIKPGQPLPGGIFLPEVGWNGGGLGAGGCDAIYVGFTSTSGRVLAGHELKTSRADWLKELNQPGKADGWADECHQFWLVAAAPDIVHDGELPHGWGLMTPGNSKTRMQIQVKPDTKTGHTPSWKAVRSIMARQDTLRASAIAAARLNARDEAQRSIDVLVEEQVQRRFRDQPGADALRERLKLLEEALGVEVAYPDRYRYGGVKLEDLAAFAQAAKAYGSVRAAVANLKRNYEITSLRRTLDHLQQNITEFAKLAETDQSGIE